jgi:hypothetical protein
MENSATPRQRWALYCITKKDYRNEILSKEEAAKLIQELGTPNYKKASKIVKNKTIADELLDYLKDHIDEMFNDCLHEIGYDSIVKVNTQPYHFIGCGCGITYIRYRKNNTRAKEIEDAARRYRKHEILDMLIKKLPKKIYRDLENKGCPFEAVWDQMMNLQQTYWYTVKDFAKTKGIDIKVISNLD